MTFSSFLSGLEKVVCGLFPILGGVLTVVAPEAVIPAEIVSALPGLIGAVENAVGDGQGPIKKAAVMQGAQLIASDMIGASTGGQKATWEKCAPAVSVLVDTIVTGINAVKPGTFDENAAISTGTA